MLFSPNLLATLVATATVASAAPLSSSGIVDSSFSLGLEKRQYLQIVPHNSLRWIPEMVRSGVEGRAMLRYEPYLHIASGCRSYPAVSQSGQVSGGLQASGSSSGGCNDGSNGQTYVRGAWHRGRYAIMYSWYFPKDQTTDGGLNGGHRHDWESVVIWIDNPANANPRVFGAAASGHGEYPRKSTSPQMRDGNRLQVEYYANLPTNHELQFKTSPGGDHAMVDYDRLDKPARDALDNYNWDRANCPFNRNNFSRNLDLAWIQKTLSGGSLCETLHFAVGDS